MADIKPPPPKEPANAELQAAKAQQFEEQCFLTDHMSVIKNTPAVKSAMNSNVYKELARVTGEPGSILNSLTRRGKVEDYLKMTPLEISSMVPNFRLFKALYDSRGNKVDEIEFVFPDNVDLQTIEAIGKSGVGRPKAVGLKSFSYEHDSSNPANLKVLKAKMTIHFQNIEALVGKAFTFSHKGGRKKCENVQWLDLIRYGKSCSGEEIKDASSPPTIKQINTALEQKVVSRTEPYQNLFDAKATSTHGAPAVPKSWTVQHELDFRKNMKKHLPGFTRNSNYYRVKVHLGWKTNAGAMSHSSKPSEMLDLVNSLGYTLFLDINQHNINFKQDGSIELETTWVGSIEGAFMSPTMDIFWIDEKTMTNHMREESQKAFKALDQELDSARNKMHRANARLNQEKATSHPWFGWTSQKNIDADAKAKAAFADASNARNNVETFKDASAQVMTLRYKMFIEEFFELLAEGGGRLFYVDVSQEQIGVTQQEWASGDKSKAMGRANKGDAGIKRQKALKIGRARMGSGAEELQGITQNAVNKVGDVGTARKTKERKKVTTNAVTGFSAKKGSNNEKDLRVHFFLFGDLIETALKTLTNHEAQYWAENQSGGGMTVALGPVQWQDPRAEAKSPFSHNIADVPISLNLFMRWWIDTAVAPIKPKWPLRQFLADATSQLVLAAMGRDCVATDAAAKTMNVKMSSLTFPTKAKKAVIARGKRTKASDLRGNPPASNWKPSEDLMQVLFVYAESNNPGFLYSDAKDDAKLGVLHLGLGRDHGPVKKFNFKRSNQSGLREAVIEREGEASDGELANHYRCAVDVIGAPFFVPGQLVHINPDLIGFGKQTAKELNMSGYYQVHKVEGVLESGKFDTTLDAIWVTHGKDPLGRSKAGKPPATTVIDPATAGGPKSEHQVYQTKMEKAKKEHDDKITKDAKAKKAAAKGYCEEVTEQCMSEAKAAADPLSAGSAAGHLAAQKDYAKLQKLKEAQQKEEEKKKAAYEEAQKQHKKDLAATSPDPKSLEQAAHKAGVKAAAKVAPPKDPPKEEPKSDEAPPFEPPHPSYPDKHNSAKSAAGCFTDWPINFYIGDKATKADCKKEWGKGWFVKKKVKIGSTTVNRQYWRTETPC